MKLYILYKSDTIKDEYYIIGAYSDKKKAEKIQLQEYGKLTNLAVIDLQEVTVE